MDYQSTLDYLYTKLPMFTRIGSAAFKKDLTNTLKLCEALGNPQEHFKCIHIAGTNGKGSVSHFIASILQEAGYKTGLYTSPHLLDFRERIKINGEMIPQQDVVKFVEANRKLIENIEPSFFEMTVAMAFDYFHKEKVDIAVIETGLGGRLDSTNIITPILSVITNISYDHQNLLGDTLQEIAGEKAGIIKQNVSVVVGKSQEEVKKIFIDKAFVRNSKISFADKEYELQNHKMEAGNLLGTYRNNQSQQDISIESPLAGDYQVENIRTVLCAMDEMNMGELTIEERAVKNGIKNVKKNTGFSGRWEIISEMPLIICDVAHNEAGLKAVFEQVAGIKRAKLSIVYGMVKDKDIEKALSLLPLEATYYFSSPQLPRALDYNILLETAQLKGLHGKAYSTIADACKFAIAEAGNNDLVLIIGSVFVVGEALEYLKK